MDHHQSAEPDAPDEIEAAAHELERAESQDDETRLAALEAVHARLSDELDKPAEQPG